jgi:hypothetical protein
MKAQCGRGCVSRLGRPHVRPFLICEFKSLSHRNVGIGFRNAKCRDQDFESRLCILNTALDITLQYEKQPLI